jgi:hypothetical protein
MYLHVKSELRPPGTVLPARNDYYEQTQGSPGGIELYKFNWILRDLRVLQARGETDHTVIAGLLVRLNSINDYLFPRTDEHQAALGQLAEIAVDMKGGDYDQLAVAFLNKYGFELTEA